MTTLVLWLVFWLICALTAYLLVRREHRGSLGKWTQVDRVYGLSVCLLYGPIMLAIVALVALALKVSNTSWAKREARW